MSLELSGNYVKAMPEFLSVGPEIELSGVIGKQNNYIGAQPTGGYTQNQMISIPLAVELLDMRSATLQFTIAGTLGGGATFGRFNKDIRSIFSRIVFRFGSKIVCDIQNAGLLNNIMDQFTDFNWMPYAGALTTGTGDTVQRNADFLNPNKVYAVQLYQLREEFFNTFIPFKKLGVQGFIDIYLAQNNDVIESDGTGCSYTVNNVQFHVASLTLSDEWNDLYNKTIPRGISYTYITYQNLYDSSLLPAGTTKASKILPFKFSSFLGIIAVMQDQTTGQTVLNKLNKFNFNNLNFAQLRIGTNNFPQDTQRSASDLYSMACDTVGKSYKAPLALGQNFDSTNFILCIPVGRQLKELEMDDKRVSYCGINTSIGSSMVLDLGFSTPLASNQTLQIFAMIENTVQYQANGSVVYYD